MIAVRTAREDEQPELLAIWRSAVEATHGFLSAEDIDWYEPLVATYLSKAGDVRVALSDRASIGGESGQRIFGFIAHDEGAIHMLFVHSDAHRMGVGSALLASLRDDLMRRDAPGVLTVDVNEQNESGRRFYAAQGFRVVSRSATDDQGRPFAILHLRCPVEIDRIHTHSTRRQDDGRT